MWAVAITGIRCFLPCLHYTQHCGTLLRLALCITVILFSRSKHTNAHLIPQKKPSQMAGIKHHCFLWEPAPCRSFLTIRYRDQSSPSQHLTGGQTCRLVRNLDDPGLGSSTHLREKPIIWRAQRERTWSPSSFPEKRKFRSLHSSKPLTLWSLTPGDAAQQKHSSWAPKSSPTTWAQRRNDCGHNSWTKIQRYLPTLLP